MFPGAVPGSVRLTTAAGTFERTVLMPKGEPANPMSLDEIEAKFIAVATPRVGRPTTDAIRTAIRALQAGDIMPLRAILAVPGFG